MTLQNTDSSTPQQEFPESALKAYDTGRWMLFTLLGAIPALLLSTNAGTLGIAGLVLLLVPAYLAFRGAHEALTSTQKARDAKSVALTATITAIGFSAFFSFGLASSGNHNYKGFALALALIVFGVAAGTATSYVGNAVKISPSILGRKTRIAARSAAVATGTALTLFTLSGVILKITGPAILVALAFFADDLSVTLLAWSALPLVVGTIALVIALWCRRSKPVTGDGIQRESFDVVDLRQTVLYSVACASYYTVIAMWAAVFFSSFALLDIIVPS